MSRQALELSKHPRRFRQIVNFSRRWSTLPVPGGMRKYQAMLPPRVEIPLPRQREVQAPVMTVLFFEGCVMQAAFQEVNRAVRWLLEASGIRVVTPSAQTCCGAIHFHSGDRTGSLELARRNIQTFEDNTAAFVVNAAGGCGAMLSEYGKLLMDDPVWAPRAHAFSAKVRDFTTLLLHPHAHPLSYVGTGERVTLQNSCHLVNVSKAGADPISLITHVEGDTFVQYPSQDICCGSGGVYNLNHTDWALGILDHKFKALAAAAPDRILVNNPGCHLQMQWGSTRHPEVGAVVEHVATYLWRAHSRVASQEGVSR